VPKVFSVQFLLFISIFIAIVIVVANNSAQYSDPKTGPLTYLPNPQDGYGSGPNQLAQPDDVEILQDGSLVVTDVDNNRIQLFSEDGKLMKSITAKSLDLEDTEILPTGISSDGDGYVYVSLEGAGRVARFTPAMELDQFIGYSGKATPENYYLPENDGLLMKPQGLIVSARGDVYVVDMAKDVFDTEEKRNFGFRKFKKVESDAGTEFVYDTEFTATQEITTIMRKSEGLAISESRGLLFVAEEKPITAQFGNSSKYRYVGVFTLETGAFTGRLLTVTMENDLIVDGYCDESIEGLSVIDNLLFTVAEKAGRVDCFDIDTGDRIAFFGVRAPFYCDDESDCIIDGVNYNEQSIMAGTAQVHLLNDWEKNELASPDGISVRELKNGNQRLAVVDQWNSRILLYDLKNVLGR